MNESQKNDQKYTEELEKIEEIRQGGLKKKKNDQIYNTSYVAVIPILSLVISIFSMIYAIEQGGISAIVCGLFSAAIALLIIWVERRALFGGRERSYYRILYSILGDL